MRALRIAGQATVHATSRHVDFHFYAHTACNLRVAWGEPAGNSPLAKPVDEPVDCMTCLVNAERGMRPSDVFKTFDQQKPRPGVVLMSSETYGTLVEGLAEVSCSQDKNMSDDFQYEPFAEEGEAFRDPAGVTHVAALVGERVVAFCGASLGGSRRAFDDDVDCMTCVVECERFAAGVLR